MDLKNETTDFADAWAQITDVEVELFDIDAVQYQAHSILPTMVGIVAALAVLAVVVVILATRKHHYDDI